MKIEGILFDWAGTTVDFGCMAPVLAFRDSFKENGVAVTEAEIRKPMGVLKHDHIKMMFAMDRIAGAWRDAHGKDWDAAAVESIYDVFEKHLMAILASSARVKPGVVDTVKKLRAQGYKIGSTTGYTDPMMAIVVPEAARQGYAPDCWFSPDSTGGYGRPYPYMIFRNMETLHLSDVRHVIKVGDTVSDIREGKAAGVWSVGVLDGSSVMGVSEETFRQKSEAEKQVMREAAARVFMKAGADAVIQDMTELPGLLEKLEGR
jgi:phosphonoacetaldehyde hydrolase